MSMWVIKKVEGNVTTYFYGFGFYYTQTGEHTPPHVVWGYTDRGAMLFQHDEAVIDMMNDLKDNFGESGFRKIRVDMDNKGQFMMGPVILK